MTVITNSLDDTSNLMNIGDNGTGATSAQPLVVAKNSNARLSALVSNTTSGTGSRADIQVTSNQGSTYVGIASAAYTTVPRFQNSSFVTTDATVAGLVLDSPAAAGTITMYTNGVLGATLSNSQVLTLANPLPPSSGGSGNTTMVLHSLYVGAGSSPAVALGSATNGQLPIGSTGANPVLATITGGAGVTVTNGAGTITISSTASGFTWNNQTANLSPMVAENAYVANKAGTACAFTLPTGATFGDTFIIQGQGATGWVLNAGAGQTIQAGSAVTSSAGSISSTNQFDSIEVVCSPTTTAFLVARYVGNLSFA